MAPSSGGGAGRAILSLVGGSAQRGTPIARNAAALLYRAGQISPDSVSAWIAGLQLFSKLVNFGLNVLVVRATGAKLFGVSWRQPTLCSNSYVLLLVSTP